MNITEWYILIGIFIGFICQIAHIILLLLPKTRHQYLNFIDDEFYVDFDMKVIDLLILNGMSFIACFLIVYFYPLVLFTAICKLVIKE